MPNNLRVFNTYNDYDTADLVKPSVSYVVSNDKVYYDPYIPFQGKWLATYSDSDYHTESAECDSSSAITKNEIYYNHLVSVEIGECVISIGTYAFSSCRSLTSVTIGSGVTSIGTSAFAGCNSLTSIDIPNGVTTIGDFCFQYAGLTSVTIGSGITSIGNGAFINCPNIASVTINALNPPQVGSLTFNKTSFISGEYPIYVPSQSVNAYKSAWSKYASRIFPIPNS